MPYRVQNLGPERLRLAFSLVRMVHPELSLEAWRRYARPRLARRAAGLAARRGILSLEDQHGCILALYAFRVEPDLRRGALMRCEYIAAIDLLNPRRAMRALIQEIRNRADITGCTAIRIATPHSPGALAAELAENGFARDRTDYVLAPDGGQRAGPAGSRPA